MSTVIQRQLVTRHPPVQDSVEADGRYAGDRRFSVRFELSFDEQARYASLPLNHCRRVDDHERLMSREDGMKSRRVYLVERKECMGSSRRQVASVGRQIQRLVRFFRGVQERQ